LTGGALRRDAHVDGTVAPVAADHDLVAVLRAIVAHRRADDRFEVGQQLYDVSADGGAVGSAEQRKRRAVGDGDAAIGVDAHHAGGYAGEDRLGEPPPRINLVTGGDKLLALRAELCGHGVEGGAKRADLTVRVARLDGDREIAARDLLGSVDQPADWR